ncbi:MAG TPA: hypothetical protein VFR58_05290 [Flavisolibacter sp.]|nr:hypothetical protein [Flavisolibacter sp.]
MISCSDLRLGNYILIRKKIERITLINNDPGFADTPLIGFEGSNDNFISCGEESVQPVVLSAEVLNQCGFSFHSHFHFWQLIDTSAGQRSEMDIDPDYNLIDFMRRPIVKKISSLHQLQNLYFALKGSEIKFDPAGWKRNLS